MITVTTTTAVEAARVHRIMRQELIFNPALCTAEYIVKSGDAPAIDGVDEYNGAGLFAQIFRTPVALIDTMLAEIRQAKADGVERVWYGNVENAVDIDDAIADIEQLNENAVTTGDWGVWE